MSFGFRVAASLSFCFALTAFEPSIAHAFCRTNSCDPKRNEECTLDASGCRQGGHDLFWESSCVTFAVQKDGSKRNDIDAGSFEQVISNAFDTWMNADCGGGKHPAIKVNSHGPVLCGEALYHQDGPNANIYVFRDDQWIATGPGNALALTTVWYDWHTGKIFDADVEVNGSIGSTDPNDPGYSQRITNGAPKDGADLPSIITHESGHFLGLDHAPFNPDATMFTFYEPGAGNLRDLSNDDVAGICAIYPPDRTAETDSCEPRHGFSSKCYVPDDGACSLKSGGSGQSSRTPGLAFALGLGSLFGARRLRRVRAQRTKALTRRPE